MPQPKLYKEDKMITLNINPTRDQLLSVISSSNGLIDLDTAAVKSGHCENIKYMSLDCYLKTKTAGKEYTITNHKKIKGCELRIGVIWYNGAQMAGRVQTISWDKDGLALLDVEADIIYVINPDDEIWFVNEFAKSRGIRLYNIGIQPRGLDSYVIIADADENQQIEKYL